MCGYVCVGGVIDCRDWSDETLWACLDWCVLCRDWGGVQVCGCVGGVEWREVGCNGVVDACLSLYVCLCDVQQEWGGVQVGC